MGVGERVQNVPSVKFIPILKNCAFCQVSVYNYPVTEILDRENYTLHP